jgi:hypothetical protein
MTTPDCCHEWFLVMGKFDWMAIDGQPDHRIMPHIPTQSGRLRVNFCPVCGADRRGCVVSADSLRDSRAMLEDC